MMELAEHDGVAMDISTPRVHESTENLQAVMALQEFMDLMPLVSEANAISEELKKVCYVPEVPENTCWIDKYPIDRCWFDKYLRERCWVYKYPRKHCWFD